MSTPNTGSSSQSNLISNPNQVNVTQSNVPSLEEIAQSILAEQRRREEQILAQIDHNRAVNGYPENR